jgi:WD40 repeat protein
VSVLCPVILQVWSGSNGELVFNLCKQVQPVYSLAPSPDGEYIATGSLGGNVAIWSLAQGRCLREVQGSGDTFDVSWSADGSLLCSCFSSGTLCVLDTTATLANAAHGGLGSHASSSGAVNTAAQDASPSAGPAAADSAASQETHTAPKDSAGVEAATAEGPAAAPDAEEVGESMEVANAAEDQGNEAE